MKVLQVLSKSVGGIRQHVATLNSTLQSLEIESNIAGPKNVMQGLCEQSFSFVAPNIKNPIQLAKTLESLSKEISRYDVVHAHGLTAAKLVLMASKKLDAPIPVVVTTHNIVDPYATGKKYKPMKAFETHIVNKADAIICPSEFAKSQLRVSEQGIDRVHTILPVGRSISKSNIDDAISKIKATRKQFRIGKDDPLIVSISRYSKQKDLDTLIIAFSKVLNQKADAKLIITGSGNDEYKRDLNFLIGRLGIAESVQLLDFVSSPNELIAAADMTVVSSRYETIPFVLLESLMLGVAVVSTETGIAPELESHDLLSVVPTANPELMANAILGFIKSKPGTKSEESSKLQSEILQKFSEPQLLIEEIVEVYTALLRK